MLTAARHKLTRKKPVAPKADDHQSGIFGGQPGQQSEAAIAGAVVHADELKGVARWIEGSVHLAEELRQALFLVVDRHHDGHVEAQAPSPPESSPPQESKWGQRVDPVREGAR